METRNITIINSKTQTQTTFESTAETLGQLKAELRNKGIEYADMAFFEGHIRAELKDDQSILPTNIPYKGRTVNDLVFMLSPVKKITSGAVREDIYQLIRNTPGAAQEIKARYGKSYTNCTTMQLQEFFRVANSSAEAEKCAVDNVVADALVTLVEALYNTRVIATSVYNQVLNKLNCEQGTDVPVLSQEDINEMFDFVK